jgi:DNA-binding MarR family transcriptional regulator
MRAASRRSTLSDVRHCTCLNLRMAARAVTQLYDDHLRPTGLRVTQFSLLVMMHHSGKASISQLAERAIMDRTTLKRNLELLQREGLVRIRPGADARVREVTLTRAAQGRLAAALPYWEAAQARMTAGLGRGRAERLLTDLSAAVAAARQES